MNLIANMQEMVDKMNIHNSKRIAYNEQQNVQNINGSKLLIHGNRRRGNCFIVS